MSLENFLATLDPKTAARVQVASGVEVIRLPLASYGLTKRLNGGIGKGRITLIYGPQSAGKTLLMLQSIARWQKMGLICAWVDAEHAFDKEWAAKLGVNVDELILITSKSSGRIEQEITPLLQARIDVVVVDSISQILPEAFVGKDGSMNAQDDRKQIGAHAKAVGALVNGIEFLNEQTAVIMISQVTTEFGQSYTKLIPHGGRRMLHAASQIIKLTSSGTEDKQIKGNIQVGDLLLEQPIGRPVDAVVDKNKLGPQSGKCKYNIFYAGKEVGIEYESEVVKEAVTYEIVKKSGSWFTWQDERFQGEEKMSKYFKDNPESLSLLEKQIHTFETGEV